MKLVLCSGRHEMPQNDGEIFPNTINPTDLSGMEKMAREKLLPLANTEIQVFVTGLTVALITVLNVCRELEIKVTLLHFDRENNSYFEQEVR